MEGVNNSWQNTRNLSLVWTKAIFKMWFHLKWSVLVCKLSWVSSTRRCATDGLFRNQKEELSQEVQNVKKKDSKQCPACPSRAQISLVSHLFIITSREFVHDKRMNIVLWMLARRLVSSGEAWELITILYSTFIFPSSFAKIRHQGRHCSRGHFDGFAVATGLEQLPSG